jgi:hypothetical protein
LILQNVNARVEVQDEDFLGKYDLIEQFECKFFPSIVERGNSLTGEAEFQQWTAQTECLAKHQPTKLR